MKEPISSHTRLLFLIALSACFFCSGQVESAQLFTFKGVLTNFTSGVTEGGMIIGPLPGPTFSPGDPFTGSAFVELNPEFGPDRGFNVSVNGFNFGGRNGSGGLEPGGVFFIGIDPVAGYSPFDELLLDNFGYLFRVFGGTGSFNFNGLSGNGGICCGGSYGNAIGFFTISGDITSIPDGGSAALLLGAGFVCLAALRRILQPI